MKSLRRKTFVFTMIYWFWSRLLLWISIASICSLFRIITLSPNTPTFILLLLLMTSFPGCCIVRPIPHFPWTRSILPFPHIDQIVTCLRRFPLSLHRALIPIRSSEMDHHFVAAISFFATIGGLSSFFQSLICGFILKLNTYLGVAVSLMHFCNHCIVSFPNHSGKELGAPLLSHLS